MEKCRTLKEYAQFIAVIRDNLSEGVAFEEAVEKAVDECIRQGILSEVLRRNRAEVVDMILTEYDENEFREYLKEESWKEGHEAGVKAGIKVGHRTGEIAGTIKTCIKFNVLKEEILKELMERYALSEEEAEKCLEEYGEISAEDKK